MTKAIMIERCLKILEQHHIEVERWNEHRIIAIEQFTKCNSKGEVEGFSEEVELPINIHKMYEWLGY